MKRLSYKLPITVFTLLGALGILIQCAFEYALVIEGFAVTKLFSAYFIWQILSIVILVVAAAFVLSSRKPLRLPAFVMAILVTLAPTFQALYFAFQGLLGQRGWILQAISTQTSFRIAVAVLPSVFTLGVVLISYRQLTAPA